MSWEQVLVKYDGRSRAFDLANMELSDPGNPTDQDLKHALGLELDEDFSGFYIDRTEETQKILNVRPDATLA